jgi:Ca-activated chloride channel family protein
MGGKRLDSAQESVVGVTHSMTERDRLSIISFASEIFVHVDGIKIDRNGRSTAIRSVEDLKCRDNTNLGAGWMKGAECVAKVMQRHAQMHNHVIILSDGHANVGLTDPNALEHHADQLRQRGVLTSCVGIGNDYSSVQLQSLADFGGGRLHDAEFPGEIIEVVLGELRELQNTAVEDISVTLRFPDSVKVENISGFPTAVASSSMLCQMGSLSPGATRSVVFKVLCPEGKDGEQLKFDITCNWLWTGSEKRGKTVGKSQVLTFLGPVRNANQPINIELSQRVAEIWQSNVVRKAVRYNREKKLTELCKYLDYELKYFARYCDDIPFTDELVAALERMRVVADHEWDERSRKSMEYTTYLTQTGQIDHRTLERAGWWKFLEERRK